MLFRSWRRSKCGSLMVRSAGPTLVGIAVCCSVLQCVAVWYRVHLVIAADGAQRRANFGKNQVYSVPHCNTLQHTATHCNKRLSLLVRSAGPTLVGNKCALYHSATHCNTLQHTAAHCSRLQQTAAHCNTLQHTAAHCSTLQHTTAHCSTLQHTATYCNTLHVSE